MTPRDKEILNRLTNHLNKMRGITTPEIEQETSNMNTLEKQNKPIKSIPLGIYVNTDRDDKPVIK